MREEVTLILEKMEELGLALSSAGKEALEFVYPLAVRQALVIGVIGVILLLTLIPAIVYTKKLILYANSVSGDRSMYAGLGAGLIIFYCIIVFKVAVNYIPQLFNPGWYAIRHIVEMF